MGQHTGMGTQHIKLRLAITMKPGVMAIMFTSDSNTMLLHHTMDMIPGTITVTTIVPTTFHLGITARGSWHTHSSTLHTIRTLTIPCTITTITVDTAPTAVTVLLPVQAETAVPGIRATRGEDLSAEYLTIRDADRLVMVVAMCHHRAAATRFLDALVPGLQGPRLALRTERQDQVR